MSTVKDFTHQSWCGHCENSTCTGEHVGMTRFVPATGGAARDTYVGTDTKVEVPCAMVAPTFFEDVLYPSGADDAPYIGLTVTDGEISLRPHEARELARHLIREVDRIEGSSDD